MEFIAYTIKKKLDAFLRVGTTDSARGPSYDPKTKKWIVIKLKKLWLDTKLH